MPLPVLPADPAHFHAILPALPGNFMLLLPDAPAYTIVAMSAELLRQTDREAAQVVGQSVFAAYPENPEEVANNGPSQMRIALDASRQDKQPHHLPLVRYDVPTLGGSFEERYWSGSSKAVLDAQGEVLYLLFTSVDMTAQLRAENEQRAVQQAAESEARFRTLVEQAPVAIVLTRGPEVIIEAVNELSLRMMHQPNAAAALGRRMVDILPELESQAILRIAKEVTETGQTFRGSEVPIALRANGELQPGFFNISYTPFIEQGQVTGIIHVSVDVTEQVRARQQVQDLNDALRQTNAELHASNQRLLRTNADLDTFVYTASHDLKAPITNIEGILAALHDTLPPAVQQDAVVARLLELLANTVSRFLTTISHLTDLARLQQTYNEPAELLALAPVVAGVVADLAPGIAAAAAQLHLAVPPEVHVSFAPASLRSIIYNLLSNAIKYRDPQRPAQVWLHAQAQPGSVVLTVRDNGLGLTQTQQQRLFGAFQRLHTHVEGTGVGLYMIKRLIDNAGATITVASTPGEGSVFTVTFPTSR